MRWNNRWKLMRPRPATAEHPTILTLGRKGWDQEIRNAPQRRKGMERLMQWNCIKEAATMAVCTRTEVRYWRNRISSTQPEGYFEERDNTLHMLRPCPTVVHISRLNRGFMEKETRLLVRVQEGHQMGPNGHCSWIATHEYMHALYIVMHPAFANPSSDGTQQKDGALSSMLLRLL